MKRKIFWTTIQITIQEQKTVGVIRKDGFEIKVGEMSFNVYVGENGTVHIIDPNNGIAVFQYRGHRDFDDDELVPDIIKVERATAKLKQSEVLEKWSAMTEKMSYNYTIKMFNALMNAQQYRERQRKLAEKERISLLTGGQR